MRDSRLREKYVFKDLLCMDSSTTSLQIYRETTSLNDIDRKKKEQ